MHLPLKRANLIHLGLSIAFVALLVTLLPHQKLDLRNQAATSSANISIENFKTPYSQMLDLYTNAAQILNFGGGMILSEFTDDTNDIYAGHLGNFWAPPHFSSQGSNTNYWQKGFNFGLVLQNNDSCFTEQASDPKTEAFWYPSKMVVSKNYGDFSLRGVKTALPSSRAFGLKLTLTNNTSTPQSPKILLLGDLPSLTTTAVGNTNLPWVWSRSDSSAKLTFSQYDPNLNLVTITSYQQSLGSLAITLSQPVDSWMLANQSHKIYQKFKRNCQQPYLDNDNRDDQQSGSAYGLVANFGNLAPGQSQTVTIVTAIDSDPKQAIALAQKYQYLDIEAESDQYWNQKLALAFQKFPYLATGNPKLDQIYLNSILSYLVNQNDIYQSLGESAGQGKSLALFPWMTGTQGLFAYDTAFWKNQLIRLISFAHTNCRAYDQVHQNHLCDVFYAYDHVSLIDAVYKYIATSGDTAFLDQKINQKTVLGHLQDYLQADNNKETNGQLANFGHDWNLYEFTRHAYDPSRGYDCDFGGKYTGIVVSPNAERVVAHRQVSRLIQISNLPDTEKQAFISAYQTKQTQILDQINATLWNPQSQWFDSISLYDKNKNLWPQPQQNTFFSIAPYFLLQYDNLLTPQQINGLMSHFDGFQDEYGLNSLHQSLKKTDGTWCSQQTDWHGPGIYSGALGAVLTGLYHQGQSNLAYDILLPPNGKGYAYLSQMPYFPQSFDATNPQASQSTAYLEGASIAQSIIEGMFGIRPQINSVNISPNIPKNLSQQNISLKNIHISKDIFDININGNQHILDIQPANPNQINLNYQVNPDQINLKINIIRDPASPDYDISVSSAQTNSSNTVLAAANSTGTNNIDQTLTQGTYQIIIRPKTGPAVTYTPTPTSTPGPICLGSYWGESQCRNRAPDNFPNLKNGQCQLNPALGRINLNNLTDSLNYWKWSYCQTSGPTPTLSPTPSPTINPNISAAPTIDPNISTPTCRQNYFNQAVCNYRAPTEYPQLANYACRLNPALGQINTADPTDSLNYWKWAYCPQDADLNNPYIDQYKHCTGQYWGYDQCSNKDDNTAKIRQGLGTCQLNPLLGQINPNDPANPVNYWKWSYCPK